MISQDLSTHWTFTAASAEDGDYVYPITFQNSDSESEPGSPRRSYTVTEDPYYSQTAYSAAQPLRSQWPDDEEDTVSSEAKDLMNKLMCLDPKKRLGSNQDEKFADGGEEIKAHPWFEGIQWETLREDEASFVPSTENPEDTEYFDSRGATMQHFAPEFQDESTTPSLTRFAHR